MSFADNAAQAGERGIVRVVERPLQWDADAALPSPA
jgi:hypothetical protein